MPSLQIPSQLCSDVVTRCVFDIPVCNQFRKLRMAIASKELNRIRSHFVLLLRGNSCKVAPIKGLECFE